METETNTRETTMHYWPQEGAFTIRKGLEVLTITEAELQAIVQQAYDEHGMLATPSYAIEAALAEPIPYALPDPLEPGRCTCGQAGCSDAGYVSEYRQGLPTEPPAEAAKRACRQAVAEARAKAAR